MPTSTSSPIAASPATIARNETVRYGIALTLVISLFFVWGLT